MPEVAVMAQFERRLLDLGCPRRWLRARVREMAEHHADLKQAALDDGLSESEAAARADAQLGDTIGLAEQSAALLRQSSWWGRHRIIGFCVLPPLVFAPAWGLCLFVLVEFCRLLGRLFGPAYVFDVAEARALSSDPEAFYNVASPVNDALNYAALLLCALLFCWLARRCAAGTKWQWIACGACAVNGIFAAALFGPNVISLGYTFPPDWTRAIIPVVVAGGVFARLRIIQNRLPAIARERIAKAARPAEKRDSALRRFIRTPTYWLTSILSLLLVVIIGIAGMAYVREEMRNTELRAKTWPVERAATLAQITSRQSASTDVRNMETIDLRHSLNATLLDSTDGPADVKDNNLSELRAGLGVFCGVPFDVKGKIQLLGWTGAQPERRLPASVNHIAIGQKCARIHLLHGASNLHSAGGKVATLVLHYANGSWSEIPIVAGEDVLDWWGPIYKTGVDAWLTTTSPGTVLAWAGSNPWIQKRSPDSSLRLYRSTFDNPKPSLEVASIDYISTLGGAAPFLVGLTVERQPESSKNRNASVTMGMGKAGSPRRGDRSGEKNPRTARRAVPTISD